MKKRSIRHSVLLGLSMTMFLALTGQENVRAEAEEPTTTQEDVVSEVDETKDESLLNKSDLDESLQNEAITPEPEGVKNNEASSDLLLFEQENLDELTETIRPKDIKLNVDQILDWERPEEGTHDIYRASVDLQERKQGEAVNELSNPDAKIQSLAYMSAKAEGHSAVGGGSEGADVYAFDYWQYLDSLVFWDGLVPTPDVMDAAHRNGVPVYGTIFFNWSTDYDDQQKVEYFLQKDEDGNYPVMDKLLDVADYYGFDGYFINQETSMPSYQGYTEKFVDILHYGKNKAQERDQRFNIAWYDAMNNSGSRSHFDAVTPSNSEFVKLNHQHQSPTDEFFMNFNWSQSKVNTTVNTMENHQRDPFDAYAGYELQRGGYYKTHQNRGALIDQDGKLKLSLGMFIPDAVMGIAKDASDYHKQEDLFWTGHTGNPTKEYDDPAKWSGMSRFVVDKTPILNDEFNTFFNTGHGYKWFVDGDVSLDKPWNARGVQDVMPTWRWWIENNGGELKGQYDFEDAYNGGTSLKFDGSVEENSQADIMLYATQALLDHDSKLKIAVKGGAGSQVLVGLTTDANYNPNSFNYFDVNIDEDWTSTTIDLKELAGQTLRAIQLSVVGLENQPDYALNVGQLALLKNDDKPQNVSNVEVVDQIIFNAQQAEAIIKVDPVDEILMYEVYRQDGENWKLVNASSSDYIYLPEIYRENTGDATKQNLKVVTVGKNGERSEGLTFEFDWKLTVDDTSMPEVEATNLMPNATITKHGYASNTEVSDNILTGTINNTADKWFSPEKTGDVAITFDEPKTIKVWAIDHAGAGGESVNDGLMNTRDYNLEYRETSGGPWKVAQEIRKNIEHATVHVLDEPITAEEWRLNILHADNGSPWGGIRIYNWKMYESLNTESINLPMSTAHSVHVVDNNYSVLMKNGIQDSVVTLYKDRELKEVLGEGTVDENGEIILHNLQLDGESGVIYYTAKQEGLNASNYLAIPYQRGVVGERKLTLENNHITILSENTPLDLSNVRVKVVDEKDNVTLLSLENMLVKVDPYDPNNDEPQKLKVTVGGVELEDVITVQKKDDVNEEVTIDSIVEVETPQLVYEVGDALNVSYGRYVIHYSDGTSHEYTIADSEVQVTGFNSEDPGEFKLTVSLEEKLFEYSLIVNEKTINYQRLHQLKSEVENIEDHPEYFLLTEEDLTTYHKFIEESTKLPETKPSQDEVDEFVADHTRLYQDLIVLVSKRKEEALEENVTFTDKNVSITVNGLDGYLIDRLDVTLVEDDELVELFEAQNVEIYRIRPVDENNKKVEIEYGADVSINPTHETETQKVYFIDLKTMDLKEIEFTQDDETIDFIVDHFSHYAIVFADVVQPGGETGTEEPTGPGSKPETGPEEDSEGNTNPEESPEKSEDSGTGEATGPEGETGTGEVTNPEGGTDTGEVTVPEGGTDTGEVTSPEGGTDTGEVTSPEGGTDTGEVTVPEDETGTGEVTGQEDEVGTGEVADPEGETSTGEVTVPEGEAGTGEVANPEGEAGTGEVADPEGETSSGEVTGPEDETGSGEVTGPEVGTDTGEVTVPEGDTGTGEVTVLEGDTGTGEVADPEGETSTGEVTNPEGETDTGEVTDPEDEIGSGEVTGPEGDTNTGEVTKPEEDLDPDKSTETLGSEKNIKGKTNSKVATDTQQKLSDSTVTKTNNAHQSSDSTDKPSTEKHEASSDETTQSNSALPETGETALAWFSTGVVSLLAGLGIVAPRFKKEED